MNTWKKPLELLREELKSFLSVTLEDAIQKVDQRFDEALSAMAQVEGQHLGLDPVDDEEMGSDDGFINDEPEEVESSSSSSSSSSNNDVDRDDELEEEDDDDDDDDEILCFPSPKKRSRTSKGKSKAKLPPAVHYKMKPQVGKRERKAPRRFSPSRGAKDEPESISDSGEELGNAGLNAISRLDRDQWNVVRRLSPEQRNRNPWWSRRVAVPINVVRDGCGYQSENNQIPRMLWDAIAENPTAVHIDQPAARRIEKCGFCGHKKKCTHRISLDDGSRYYVGRMCVEVAQAWHDLSQLLADARHVELEQVFDALSALETAHAGKAGRHNTERYK